MAVREIREIKADIRELSRNSDTMLLAHYYCDPDVTDVCDVTGDEAELLRAADECTRSRLMVCGCTYIAEKIKILRPELSVISASPQSRCPMSAQLCAARVETFLSEHPKAEAICGLVFPADVTALCSACFTQRNAAETAASVDCDELLIITDNALARRISAACPDKKISLLSCRCPAFNNVGPMDVTLARQRWPNCAVVANSMCSPPTTESADFCGSSSEILEYCDKMDTDAILLDEISIGALLKKHYPERNYYQIASGVLQCGNMKRLDLEGLERALLGLAGAAAELPVVSTSALERIARMVRTAVSL